MSKIRATKYEDWEGAFGRCSLKCALSRQREKEHVELDYIARQSFRFDLDVFVQWMQSYFASKGNIKARGQPHNDS
jgi:hypothetical protein